MSEQTTFHRETIKQLEDEFTAEGSDDRSNRTGYVVYNLMSDINQADRSIRRSAEAIRGRLAELERNLDAFGSVYQVHISNPTSDMTEAIAKREVAFSTLAVLLGDRLPKALADSRERFAAEAEAKK
jgi:hypothetical protein